MDLHPKTRPTMPGELSIFTVPMTQIAVLDTFEMEHKPNMPITGLEKITVDITPPLNHYTVPSEVTCRARVRIGLKKTGGGLVVADFATMFTTPNLLHSLFSSVEMLWGGRQLTRSPQYYPYRAYLETVLGTTAAGKIQLESQGWTASDAKATKLTSGIVLADVDKGQYLELYGKLHFDLAFQDRSLMGGIPLTFKLTPNNALFVCNFPAGDGTGLEPFIAIEELSLFTQIQIVSDDVVLGHQKAIEEKDEMARYPINRTEVRYFHVPTTNADVTIDNVLTGVMPRRMLLCFENAQAFAGHKFLRPFTFAHNTITFVCLYLDGVMIPGIPYTPNFETGEWNREYHALHKVLNQNNRNPKMEITKEDFKTKLCIFAFNLSPDLNSGCCISPYVSPPRQGAARARIVFKTRPTTALNGVMLCEFDNLIEIDQWRQVHIDY